MFSRLTNAPGHPGLVELIIEALEMLPTSKAEDGPSADYSAEIKILRGLHRDLVTLQQRWDELIEAVFPVVFPAPLQPASESESRATPTEVSVGARAGQTARRAPAPLPMGWMMAHAASGGSAARTFRIHPGSKQQRLALVAVLALLVVMVIGILLAAARSAATFTPGNPALAVAQYTSTASTALQSTPTRTIPSPMPTQVVPTPTPRPPTPRPPTPTPNTAICPAGSVFCVSTVQLQVPCAGDGSVTFQLISNTGHNANWQAISLLGGSLLTIDPASGALKQNRTVTLSVHANMNGSRSGIMIILGPSGTAPINMTVQVCTD
jgi:hypothetical protein